MCFSIIFFINVCVLRKSSYTEEHAQLSKRLKELQRRHNEFRRLLLGNQMTSSTPLAQSLLIPAESIFSNIQVSANIPSTVYNILLSAINKTQDINLQFSHPLLSLSPLFTTLICFCISSLRRISTRGSCLCCGDAWKSWKTVSNSSWKSWLLLWTETERERDSQAHGTRFQTFLNHYLCDYIHHVPKTEHTVTFVSCFLLNDSWCFATKFGDVLRKAFCIIY